VHGREGGVEWSSVNSLKRSRSFGGIRAVGRGFPKGPVRLWMIYMQRIYPTSLTPEQYGEQEYHKQVKPPENCPNCQQAHILEGLAYYHRYITTATALVLLIWVRRFLCRHCRISVSCLPQFAQPYRPVNTPTIAAGFNGQDDCPEVQRWSELIGVYWRRFKAHLPLLLRQPTATGFWRQLLRHCGDMAARRAKPQNMTGPEVVRSRA